MPNIPARHLQVLKTICNLPTAPFCEEHVARWLETWASTMGLKIWRDAAGNLYVEYVQGDRSESPFIVEAHMDHPGFLVAGIEPGEEKAYVVKAEFRGGVKPSYFAGALAKFWVEQERRWTQATVLDVTTREGGRNGRTPQVQRAHRNGNLGNVGLAGCKRRTAGRRTRPVSRSRLR